MYSAQFKPLLSDSPGLEAHYASNDPMLNKSKKICAELSNWNREQTTISQVLSDSICFKNLPRKLSLLKQYLQDYLLYGQSTSQGECEVEPLSILAYEIMRGWCMPELYNLGNVDESNYMDIDSYDGQ